MKIRNGFVSNSSSSSFILKLKEPLSKKMAKSFFKEYKYEMYDEGTKVLTPEHMSEWLVDRVKKLNFSNIKYYDLDLLLSSEVVNSFYEEHEQEIKEEVFNRLHWEKDFYSNQMKEYEKLNKEYEALYDKIIDISFSSNPSSEDLDNQKKYEIEQKELYSKMKPFYKIDEEFYAMQEKVFVEKIMEEKGEEINQKIKDFYFYSFEVEGQGNGWDGLESTSMYEKYNEAVTDKFKDSLYKG